MPSFSVSGNRHVCSAFLFWASIHFHIIFLVVGLFWTLTSNLVNRDIKSLAFARFLLLTSDSSCNEFAFWTKFFHLTWVDWEAKVKHSKFIDSLPSTLLEALCCLSRSWLFISPSKSSCRAFSHSNLSIKPLIFDKNLRKSCHISINLVVGLSQVRKTLTIHILLFFEGVLRFFYFESFQQAVIYFGLSPSSFFF